MSHIKAYSYVRFSSFRQMGNDSVRRQVALAEKYAIENKLDLQELSMQDKGVSAFKGDNVSTGALGEFIKLIEAGEIEKGSYLLVESLDRLSRQKVVEALEQFLRIARQGIVIVTLSDGQVYRGDELRMEQLLISITIMSRANEESEIKSQRTKSVWNNRKKEAREKGTIITNSNYPKWLKRTDSGLEAIPERKELITRMFKLSLQGFGYEAIAKQLNSEGNYTFQNGTVWRSPAIGDILKNRAVLGEYQPHIKVEGKRVKDGEPMQNYYPSIIEPALFLEVNLGIKSRNNRGSGHRAGQFKNLFTGLLKCNCGTAVTIGSQRSDGVGYLKCTLGCKGATNYNYTEPQMLTALSQLKQVITKYKKPITNDVATLKLEQERLEENIKGLAESLAERFSAGVAGVLADSEDKLNIVKESIQDSERKQAEQEAKEHVVLGLEKLDTPEARGEFNGKLRAVLDKIVVTEHGKGKALIYYADGMPVLEQHFSKLIGAHGSESSIYEMDGTLVGMTTSKKPLQLIIDEQEAGDFDEIPNANSFYVAL